MGKKCDKYHVEVIHENGKVLKEKNFCILKDAKKFARKEEKKNKNVLSEIYDEEGDAIE